MEKKDSVQVLGNLFNSFMQMPNDRPSLGFGTAKPTMPHTVPEIIKSLRQQEKQLSKDIKEHIETRDKHHAFARKKAEQLIGIQEAIGRLQQ